MDFFPTDTPSSLPSASNAAPPSSLPATLDPSFPPYGNMMPPLQYNPFPTPFYEPPMLDPTYESTSIDDFLREIEGRDPRRHLMEYSSSFVDLGYLDLSEIFWMDVQALQLSTGMPVGVAHLVRREMDECRKV